MPQFSLPATHKQQQWKFQLMQNWDNIAGNLASKISIHKIYNSAIIIGVSDISWMQELYMLSELIKQKINKSIDKPRIEKIRFQYVAKKTKNTRTSTEYIPEAIKEKKLSSREKAALDKIDDPELSQALARLLIKCHQ